MATMRLEARQLIIGAQVKSFDLESQSRFYCYSLDIYFEINEFESHAQFFFKLETNGIFFEMGRFVSPSSVQQ